MRIYIPTYRRVDSQITFHRLSPRWQARTTLVAYEEEADELGGTYPVEVCPVRGIGPKRQWIIDQHDVERWGPVAVMMDDDLGFAARRTDDPTKFRKMGPDSHADVDAMMTYLQTALTLARWGSIRTRSGANQDPHDVYLPNRRVYQVLALHVPTLRTHGLRADRVAFMEDFDLGLQLLSLGYRSLTVNRYVKDDLGGANAPGGCSTSRTNATQTQAALALAKLWPAYVQTVERPGWQGLGGDTRLDVRVQWAKAYRDGLEARDMLGLPPEPDISFI